MIFNYLEMYPNAHIHMIVENTRELLKKLDEGEIDFALVEGFFKKNEYDFQKYSEEPYIAVCSPDYPFKKKPKRIEDLFGRTYFDQRGRIGYARSAGEVFGRPVI